MDTKDQIDALQAQKELLQTVQEGKEELERMYQNIQKAVDARAGARRQVDSDIEQQRDTKGLALEAIISEVARLEALAYMEPLNVRHLQRIKQIASEALRSKGIVRA